jgi:hypothetical protein
MKKLILTTLIAASATFAHAELTPKEFGQVRDWAHREGYLYRGIDAASTGVLVYMFEGTREASICYAPVSSDTPDEAINSLIGSAAVYRDALIVAKKLIREAYEEGRASVSAEETYRQGYIDGSRLRTSN